MIGRRSLLIKQATADSCQFVITSVSPHVPPGSTTLNQQFSLWQELPPGIHSISADSASVWNYSWHPWEDPLILSLASWRRESACLTSGSSSLEHGVQKVLEALSEAVKVRVDNFQGGAFGQSEGATCRSLGILFSGGLDSMLLAVLADRHLAASGAASLSSF